MKYMIMLFGSQQDIDALTGNTTAEQVWTAADAAKLHEFMGAWNQALVDSGEFVDARGLSAPAHARRVSLQGGVPVVTDGPYSETEEVLVGYTVVECESFDRATDIAAQLANTPHPDGATLANEWYVDVRPIAEGAPEFVE